jgi:hypothetical protein
MEKTVSSQALSTQYSEPVNNSLPAFFQLSSAGRWR